MANRLFVQKIVSIGLVNRADNPDAEVVIFKARDTETGAERLARLNRSLADLNQRIDRLIKKRENRRSTRLANIPERNNPMTVTAQELNELVIAKLDAYARKQQFEGEIAGRYGYLSTPREQMVVKIKAKWWDTPDGEAVRELVRGRGGDPADPTSIEKSQSDSPRYGK